MEGNIKFITGASCDVFSSPSSLRAVPQVTCHAGARHCESTEADVTQSEESVDRW